MDSDSLTEHAILSHFQVPTATLCESIQPLQQEITATRESINQLKQKHGIAEGSAASSVDVLLLNVGGSEMSVKRKHMTEGEGVEGTLLAVLFSGKLDNRFIKDDKQRVFLDVDAEAFRIVHKTILGRKLLSPVQEGQLARKGYRPQPAVGRPPSVTAGGIPTTASGLVTALNDVLKAYHDKKSKLEGELRAEKIRYEQHEAEIQAASSFLAPMDGSDLIRSVDVCGEVISTCQSTIDSIPEEMALKRRNTESLWGSSVHEGVHVPPDHMSRLIDHHRRKRHGASDDEARVPLQLTDPRAQRAFDVNAAMYGIVRNDTPAALQAQQPSNDGFILMLPTGVRYRTVTAGTGRTPRVDSTVRYDLAAETYSTITVGRHIILPHAVEGAKYIQLQLISIL
ncbi:unnamed protein product [Vitrella brassicaformis CCMP3155]|uniref:Potassium channel tetramerisation-type BTB domain-containing protein n=1 Tax=Vitrella brassicaformis (strain CCMP3155) TaxID=1169540 RepID=A0A0G4G197_VITBC|nr:unnamed protein product [Vitrella brassicaformis CCMP3155]|eukprot:CEM21865.1 unnamed protein product [Vitrella brassicaformis CCMP3155]